MKTIAYKIQFFSHWHVSSGLSGGAYADLLVLKDDDDFPYIPGKTLKGLLRDAADHIHSWNPKLVTASFISEIFGDKTEDRNSNGEVLPKAGLAYFSDAVISSALKKKILLGAQEEKQSSENANQQYFYDVWSSTRIDREGVAVDHSLRQLEVTVPLRLYATIYDVPEDALYREQLEVCMKFIKQLGVNRSRGLGRCQFELI